MGGPANVSLTRAVPIALLLALAAPAVAHADASLSVTGSAPHKTLTFTVNDALDHSTSSSALSGNVVITDSVALTVGASGCIALDARTANCGPAVDFERVVFAFAGGDDDLSLGGYFPIAVSADGGGGDDVVGGSTLGDELTGGPGDDELYGAEGSDVLAGGVGNDYLEGEEGVDTFDGGDGDDDLQAAETPATTDAAIACGAGDDLVVDYDDGDPIDDDCETIDPPVLEGPLSINGLAYVGQVLALSLPTNVGGDGDGFIQWERCDARLARCADIAGADGATYTVTEADLGQRIRARYWIVNALDYDLAVSAPTGVVVMAPAPRPPTQRVPRPPSPRVTVPTFVIPPLLTVRKPYFALPNGDPIVDTGRAAFCPGATGGVPCRLKVTARPSGASARWRGRPASAGEASVLVAAARPGRVRVPLNLRAYRLLRAHHRLTLSVTATITRPHSKLVRSTFPITVRTRAHKRR
jgi:hypothetical protein